MGEIFRRSTNVTMSYTLVVGQQELIPIRTLSDPSALNELFEERKNINFLVNKIFYGWMENEKEKKQNDFLEPETIQVAFYTNCFGHAISIMNDSIINLITDTHTKLYSTQNGVIIFYGERDMYLSVDMQQLNFVTEFEQIFNNNRIIKIFERNGCDYITFENDLTHQQFSLALESVIDLKKNIAMISISTKALH